MNTILIDVEEAAKDLHVVRSPVTGWLVVVARPGARKITSEEIYELRRGSGL